MDTSETYIKMCDWAKIQELADFELQEDGLWFWNILDWVEYTEEMDKKKERPIWLPRQDQLQEMVNPPIMKGIISFCMLNNFNSWFNENPNHCLDKFTSVEQLWLAFVMFELHQKHWSGTEWVASC